MSAALDRLFDAVQREPWAHDFFALLRRIDALRPEAPRTGAAARPQQEALRLAQPPELDFAPAPLARLELRDGAAPRLSVRFLGLLGPQGPMPLHFTEYLRERVHHHGDSAPAHFLDIFHHRALSLFYRAWAQTQPVVHADRPQDDRFIAWLGALAGLPAATRHLPREALASRAGLLAGRSRCPEALRKAIGSYFAVPVEVQPHAGQWLEIERDDRSRLGFARNRAERARTPGAALGRNANAGTRLWDRQYRFRLRLGPLALREHAGFLPGGTAWTALREWVGLLAAPQLHWELELALTPEERPVPKLENRPRLGVTSWIGRGPATRGPARELRLRPLTSWLARRASAA